MQSEWLRELSSLWKKRIDEAKEVKARQFGDEADTLWSFLTKDYRDLYIVSDDTIITDYSAGPYYKPRINKCREFVDLYMPFVLANTPARRVSVNRPVFSEEVYAQALDALNGVTFGQVDKSTRSALETAAVLQEWWLNYCAREYQLLREARLAVTDALVKGRGLLWHGLIDTSAGTMPAAFYESVDNLFIDPTARTMRDAGYIIRRRYQPAWLVAEQMGIDQDKLIAMCTGKYSASSSDEKSSDVEMVQYYEVYSRIGSGARLAKRDDPLSEVQQALDEAGAYLWFLIADGGEYPLNLDPDLILGNPDLARQAVQWPVATYGDVINPWPMSVLDFYPNVNNPWATSPLKSGLPFQVFLDHLYGYVVSQARRATRQVVIVPEHIDKRLIDAVMGDKDFEVVPISVSQTTDFANEVYHIISFPSVPSDMWQMISLVEQRFEKAVGLDPVLYGAQPEKQLRSATEVQVRYQAATGRAQYMAEHVDEWMGMVASKDGLLSRLHVPFTQIAGYFVEPILQGPAGQPLPGGPLSAIWGAIVNTDDPVQASQDFFFDVVVGSGRRKDKQQQSMAAQMIAQTLMPVALQVASQTGDFTIFNRVLERLSNAMDLDLGMFRMEPQPVAMPQQTQPQQAQSQRSQQTASVQVAQAQGR